MKLSHSMQSAADIPSPFESYSGDGPYSFISYAHADKVKVYQTIRGFREKGINIWYDEGIPPAGEWVDELAQAIKKSSSFVVFVSPRSADSRYVRMEVQYALSENKEILTIFLEDTQLPPGLSLCLQQFQSISTKETNWAENACKALLIRQDSYELNPPEQKQQESPVEEEEIDYAIQLWSSWSKALEAQNRRFEKRHNLKPNPKYRIPETVSEPITPPEIPELIETAPLAPTEDKSNKTRHPFALDVTITKQSKEEKEEPQKPHLNDYAGAFKWIPPGEITILVPYSDERRLVHVRDGFWLGEYVVTQAVYAKIMGSNPSFSELALGEDSDNYPVNNISWLDAVSFCRALTMLANNEGTLPAKHEYRLPTEVEWEYACRAGSLTDYYFGDDPSELHKHGWFRGNSRKQMHPVGLKFANDWGLFDLYGNVREWVGNSFVNTLLNDSEQDEFRISRGGAYMKPAVECKSSSRSTNSLHHRFRNLGFRVALAPSPTL